MTDRQIIEQIARDEVRKHAAEKSAHGATGGPAVGQEHNHTGGDQGPVLNVSSSTTGTYEFGRIDSSMLAFAAAQG